MTDRLSFTGTNDTKMWGLDVETRARRIAAKAAAAGDALPPDSNIEVDRRFAFDPLWYGFVRERPGAVLTLGGETVLAHRGAAETRYAVEDGLTIYNHELRKREKPFVDRLVPETVRSLEKASYYAAYKGVTDVLTKYLWPQLALVLTRQAARLGMTPNMITLIGAILCVATFFLWWEGWYWTGMATAFVFMVLDTVDGKLARCTITSSWWGNIFDHGIDLVHPPFWWWAWGAGLATAGVAMSEPMFYGLIVALVIGYVLQRLIEGYFIHRVGMHIHVWERVDTRFRLITARRNPNMVILLVSLLLARPDLGLWGITIWTGVSLLFHFVRMCQAIALRGRGIELTSWLVGEDQEQPT
ncbi:MAG: CDP-alcohol phosphatidyltransferase family protein [Pacificimonas sp.]